MIFLTSSLLVLLAGAVLAVLLARHGRAGLMVSLVAMVLGSAGYVAAAVGRWIDTAAPPQRLIWPLPLGAPTLTIDYLSAWFLLTLGLLSAVVAVYSWSYFSVETRSTRATASVGAVLCLLVASMGVLLCAGDVILFLVGWEMTSLAAFFLVGFHDEDPAARHGAWTYLIATHLSSALFLVPMFALLVAVGGWSFAGIGAALGVQDSTVRVLIFALGLAGFGVKAGFMPVHVWLPLAHPVAPTPVSALLSGVVVKIGIYGLLRLLMLLGPLPGSCGTAMIVLGAVSGVLGVLYALAQHDIKRLLAYHTVENIGIIGIGIGVGMLGQTTGHPLVALLGYSGALLHVLNHALFKGLLFLSAGAVIHATGTGQIDRLGGLAKKTPLNALLFLLAAVAICGLPPLNGFISEWLIYGGLLGGTIRLPRALPGVAVVGLAGLALMGGLALACFAKVFSVVFLGSPREALTAHATPRLMLGSMSALAVLCLLIGLAPSVATDLIAPGAAAFVVTPYSTSAASTFDAILAPAGHLSALLALLLALVIILLLVRHLMIRGQIVITAASGRAGTWGCGYPALTPRIQYTASSFAWSLIRSFRRLLWPHKHLVVPAGAFPSGDIRAELSTHTNDIAQTDIFSPFFKGAAQLAAMIRTVSLSGHVPTHADAAIGEDRGPFRTGWYSLLSAVRRGSIQVCVVYVAATLVLVFMVETAWQPRSGGALVERTAPAISMSADPSQPTARPTATRGADELNHVLPGATRP